MTKSRERNLPYGERRYCWKLRRSELAKELSCSSAGAEVTMFAITSVFPGGVHIPRASGPRALLWLRRVVCVLPRSAHRVGEQYF